MQRKYIYDQNGYNDSDKGCKCKQSMCVKLYCACFKAENYCGDDCCCKECFNRLDYEDTVEMARDKAKLREPLAFEPKILTVEQQSPRSNNTEGGNQLMPTLIRKHRKGCTCKNSECLRLYCECYKGQVGCSSVCRCVGCKNSYGKRGEYDVCNPPHIMRATNEFTHGENRFLQSSNPVTTIQYPDRGNYTSTNGSYIPLPVSSNINMIGANRRELDIVPLNQQSYPNVDPINQFTPQEINQMMMEWNPNESINVYDNTRLNIIQSEPYIPSSSGSVSSPDYKQ